jgi:hypothetical protein
MATKVSNSLIESSAGIAKAWVNFDGYNLSNVAGTYTQSGTTVTVTIPEGHNLSINHVISADVTGSGVDGSYRVASVTSPTVFTYTAASRTASGNITLPRCTIRSSYNVSVVSKLGAGDYAVNFTTPMADAEYSASGICGNEGVPNWPGTTVPYIIGPTGAPTTTTYRVGTGFGTPNNGTGGLAIDCIHVSIHVFGN